MLNNFLNILFPETCPSCAGRSHDHSIAPFCSECWQSLAVYNGPKCQRCSKPLVSDVSILCGECIQDEPAFTYADIFSLYDGPLKKAINLLKYHGVKRLSKPLSNLLSRIKLPQVDTVIPIPLHQKRLRQREYNQSALIAYHVAKRLERPLVTDCLIKIKDTPPQVGLSSKNRRLNIKNAFEVRSNNIKGGKILLIDDVVTTGATIRECSGVLKKAGVRSVYVIALAHRIMD